MTQYVICALQMEGFHCWPEADGELAYLKNSHRHIFFITAEFPVRNANREIEIISQQNAIKRYLLSKYGDEDGACHFGRRSCEDIAAEILNQFENSTSCTVLEDGFGQTSGEPDAVPQAVPYTELPLDAEGYPVE